MDIVSKFYRHVIIPIWSRRLPLYHYVPEPALQTPTTPIERPRFPVIDFHNHLGRLVPGASFSGTWSKRPVNELVAELDRSGVQTVVDLDGGYGDQLCRELERYHQPYPDRFLVFAGIDYNAFEHQSDPGAYLAHQLQQSAAAGAHGLKIWKLLGLHMRDKHGRLIAVNDQRLDPLWAAAGELNLPILMHVGDPLAFFRPFNRHNERWEELDAHPDWRYWGKNLPALETLLDQFRDVVVRHPQTTFIGAHVGCYAENLAWVGEMLDTCPNYYVDISARLAEIGRQPYTAHDFFTHYADHILFGTDSPPDVATYRLYYRFLESRDEHFDYSTRTRPPQGRWQISGIQLSDGVLDQLYSLNAARVLRLPGTRALTDQITGAVKK